MIMKSTKIANGPMRVRGFVEHGSVLRHDSVTEFVITDGPARTPVYYSGPMPDTFQEGAQVMAIGRMTGGRFVAEQVAAKCPDTYNTKDGPKPAAQFR